MPTEKPEFRPMDEQEQWNSDVGGNLNTLPLPSKKQWEGLMAENAARGLGSSSAPSSSQTGLVESVMRRHGFTEEKALEMLEAFGA